jgi:hypothetical protein
MRTRLAVAICSLLVLFPTQGLTANRRQVLYLHGDDTAGEAQLVDVFVFGDPTRQWMNMDGHKPEDGQPKSRSVPNALQFPATSCSGNPWFPVWEANVQGIVKGGLKVDVDTVATPGSTLAFSLFRDLKTSDCYSASPGQSIFPYEYKPPMAVATAEVPPGSGHVTVAFKRLNFEVSGSLILQVQIFDQFNHPGGQVRLLYDSADHPSSITFVCEPPACRVP